MGSVEALRLALAKEEEALALYQKFALDFSAAKETFLFLVGEESKHKALIEKKIIELTK